MSKLIPKRLRNKDFRFCLVGKKSKAAIEPGWQKGLHKFNSPRLNEHLKSLGNYGVIGGFGGLVIIDFDDLDVFEKLNKLLPPTFQVKTGGGKYHSYYFCDEKKAFSIHSEGKPLIDYQAKGKMVLAPGSIHNKTKKKYVVASDVPIATIDAGELKKTFLQVFEQKHLPAHWFLDTKNKNSQINKKYVDLETVLKHYNVDTSKHPTTCPFCADDNCFSFDLSKNVWNCFNTDCKKKGTAINFIMEHEKISFKKALRWIQKTFPNTNHQPPLSTLDEKKKSKRKKAEKAEFTIFDAYNLINNHIEDMFGDENAEAWVQYNDGGSIKFGRIDNYVFKDFIYANLLKNGIILQDWPNKIMQNLISQARRNRKQKLHNRYAKINDTWYIQVAHNKALKIDQGVISEESDLTLFRVFDHQLPIKYDLSANMDDIQLLKKYTNFSSSNDYELFCDVIPAFLVPTISKPIMLVKGDPNSAKSTFCKMLKKITDPSNSMKDGIKYPKKHDDWVVNGLRHAVLYFDNISYLTADQQDDCCTFITGKSIEIRKLYTPTDAVTGKIKGSILINGIDFTHLKSDFLDRSLMFNLHRIDEKDKIADEEFNKNLNNDLPKIIGAIFKILAKAQTLVNEINTSSDFRLSDFAKYGAACALARGRTIEQFESDLKLKSQLQKDEGIAQSVIATPIIVFMEDKPRWEGTAKELMKLLESQEFGKITGSGEFEKEIVNIPKYWIKSPQAFGKELSRIAFLLKYNGIILERPERSSQKRTIILKNINFADSNVTNVIETSLLDEGEW